MAALACVREFAFAIAISDAGTALATGLPTLLVARLGVAASRPQARPGMKGPRPLTRTGEMA